MDVYDENQNDFFYSKEDLRTHYRAGLFVGSFCTFVVCILTAFGLNWLSRLGYI